MLTKRAVLTKWANFFLRCFGCCVILAVDNIGDRTRHKGRLQIEKRDYDY